MAPKKIQPVKTPIEKLAEARTNLAEKVSVAGLKEALQEDVLWIRRMFQLAVFAFSCCIVWKTRQIIIDWLYSGSTAEVNDEANLDFFPVSNVTICAQVFFNETFVRENIFVPAKVAVDFARVTGQTMEQFYYQLTLFLSITTRPRMYDPTMLAFFSKVIRANPQIYDYSAFASAALPRCENMLKRCSFNGLEFDCCDRAVQSVDDDGTCYQLALNFDSDNTAPTNLTWHQTNPGPRGGLTIETSMPLAAFPWMDDVEDNGYRIYVNAIPLSAVQSPLGAPDRAETFVKVTPSKRSMSANCAPRGQLKMNEGTYYDPEGYNCGVRELMSVIKKYASCHFPFTLYRPNNTIVCHPLATYFVLKIIAESDLSKMSSSFASSSRFSGLSQNGALKALAVLETDMRKMLSGKSWCPKHCHYWTYSSTASFVYLERNVDHDNVEKNMFSKIHVYYADLGYRHYQEVKETKGITYLAFCNFSNVAMLYLGMSAVSFFDLLFHLCHYLYALGQSCKRRQTNLKVKRRLIKDTKVHPLVNTTRI